MFIRFCPEEIEESGDGLYEYVKNLPDFPIEHPYYRQFVQGLICYEPYRRIAFYDYYCIEYPNDNLDEYREKAKKEGYLRQEVSS